MKIIATTIIVLVSALSSVLYAQKPSEINIYLNDKSVMKFTDVDSISFASKNIESPLSITMDEVNEVWAQYTSACSDPNLTYNIMYLEKRYFDLYSSDEEVIEEDMIYFQELADAYGMPLKDVLEVFLIYGEDGDFTDWMCELVPEEEYVVWAYGLDSDGNVLSPMITHTFKTPAVEMTDKKIAVTLSEETQSITIEPEDNSLRYIAFHTPKDDSVTDEEIISNMQKEISAGFYDYLAGGATISDALDAISNRGEHIAQLGEITPGSYYMMAAYINETGAINSLVYKVEFTVEGESNIPSAKAKTLDTKVKRHTTRQRMIAR